MVDFQYDIASLPDYPALQQLGRALWRDGSVRGASILVGAGLSKNARRPSDESPQPPLWWELLDRMIERLYPHDPKAAPSNPLRIAEEYRTYFGQSGLDEFIRNNFPEKSWTPGPLHSALLELPWTDVLTTNWDTLLERAAEDVENYSYEVVRTEADLTYARSPRIVKLHGTLGDMGPLIFAEEDYRTYPTKYAAFVNFARQVFIENELCLVGFSGDDPNFLQWAGWVRDHLGGSARRIYLVGNLRLERATRRYLEAHNIAPIDFAPLLKELPRNLQHAQATAIFFDELRKAEPPPRYEWRLTPSDQFPLPRAGGDVYDRIRKDHALAAELLTKSIPLFKADRESYPGWLVCPRRHRETLLHAGQMEWLLLKPVLDLLERQLRAEVLFEILWRRTISFSPLDVRLAAAMTELAEAKLPEVSIEMRLEFALALMRDARFSSDDDAMNRWSSVIESEAEAGSAILQHVAYQRCLRARDRMELAALQSLLASLTSDEPVWKLRRAALHAEIGEYATATKLIKDAASDLERRYRLDRSSLSIKSQLAWAAWLNRAAELLSARWNELPQLRDFSELNIDPDLELEHIKNSAAEIEKKRRENEETIRPTFEAGHYRDGSGTIRLGAGNSGILLLYELDQLIEQVGLPIRINSVNVCASAAIAVVEEAQQGHLEWRIWLLRSLHSHLDRSFERHFSRVAIAQMGTEVSSALIAAIESAITFWTGQVRDFQSPNFRRDLSHSEDALRLSFMTLSRLTVWMPAEQAADALRRACHLAWDTQFSSIWLIEALGEIAKHAAAAVPIAQQGSLALEVLEFPLPSEKNVNLPSWPRLVTDIWYAKPVRDVGDTRWDRRIHQLIAAAQKGHPDRAHATLRLAYLALRNTLNADEAAAYGRALWSEVDATENGLPQNTALSISSVLQLPADDAVDVKARLGARLLNIDLRETMKLQMPIDSNEIRRKANHLNALTQAFEVDMDLPADVAARMFDEIVAWEPQTVDRQDPFATSFIKQFNDSTRLAVGYLLALAVVPALQPPQRTEQRARDLMGFITRTRSWTSLGALPAFWASAQDLQIDVVSIIRRGLIGSDSQHVAGAATAISGWAKLVHDGVIAELPRSLVEQLIATIETCREIGLAAMLDTARELIKTNFLHDDDLKRLLDTIAVIRGEFRYENTEFDTMRAVSVSLVRTECVRLAAALIEHIADDGTLQGWIDDSRSDPLPEVRFALTTN